MCGGGGGPDPVYETEADRAAVRIAVQQYNLGRELDYLKDYQEEGVDARRSQGAEGFVAGKANLSVQKKFSESLDGASHNLNNSGVDPSSGRATGMKSDMHETKGEAGANATFNAKYENETQGLAGVQNIIATSMGDSGQTQRGLNDIATMSVNDAVGDAFSSFNANAANTQAVGMAAGVGASTYRYASEKGG